MKKSIFRIIFDFIILEQYENTKNIGKLYISNTLVSKSISIRCFPPPLFKNDPVYMKRFDCLIADFQTRMVNFNLKFLVDRINELEAIANSRAVLGEPKFDDKIKSELTNLKSKESLSYSERFSSYYNSSFDSDKVTASNSNLLTISSNRNFSNHSYNLRTFSRQSQTTSYSTSKISMDKKIKVN